MYYDGDWKEVSARACTTLAAFLNTNGIPVGDDFLDAFQAARARGWKLADEAGIERTVEDALRETLTQLGRTTSPDGLLPRALRLVSDAWQLPPDEVVMVGDSPQYDILGAHRASMRGILIDHGGDFWWQKIPDELANDLVLHADVTVHALAEIPSVIEKM